MIASVELREILIRLKDGESDSLRALMVLLKERLSSEATKMLNDEHLAESATNYVFFRLWYRATFYREDKPPMPYVISVLRNHCRDILRTRAFKNRPISIEDLGDMSDETRPRSLQSKGSDGSRLYDV